MQMLKVTAVLVYANYADNLNNFNKNCMLML